MAIKSDGSPKVQTLKIKSFILKKESSSTASDEIDFMDLEPP
jgi:hypothetical protein